MLYRNHQQRPRQGIILLVVLALLTLFASIGVAFVYFSEAEVNKSAGQKTGETVKLPDADLLFNIVLKQLIFPTNNTNSAFITHSLLENMYGSPRNINGLINNVGNINAYNGTGRRPYFYRDGSPGVRDFDLQTLGGNYIYDAALVGQDEQYRINFRNRAYIEELHGSLNPTYTYPDQKNAYLGAVAANWTDRNGIQHGPVAIARSFAREMKFRIAVVDTNITDPMVTNVVRYHEVLFNPYTNMVNRLAAPFSTPWPVTTTTQNESKHQSFWSFINGVGNFEMALGDLPSLPPGQVYSPNPVIQCNANGTNARIVLNGSAGQTYSLRPDRRLNPFFPPPGDKGGDVKNLPPEVKTLVGFTVDPVTGASIPEFANNDSYWMDFGFPAIPWSNNRKVKPLAAVFIKDNDGNVNVNIAGNLRGRDVPAVLDPNATGHLSAHGLGPWEISLLKMYPASVPMATRVQELRNLIAGAQIGSSFERGRAGFATDADPTTSTTGYWPLVRGAPYYSLYNLDGSNDGLAVTNSWLGSNPWQLAGDPVLPNTERGFLRSPYFFNPLPAPYLAGPTPANGFLSGALGEISRNGFVRSPLFISPFAPPQVSSNAFSTAGASVQRRFGFHNQESLYRMNDTGTDKIDGEIRKLMPNLFLTAQQRWQMTTISNDLNVVGISPWHNNTADYTTNRTPAVPPAVDLDSNLTRGAGASAQLPVNSLANGEYSNVANYLWRSAFGNQNRIDLSRQLPDYPVPANNNAHLDLMDNIVRSRYMVALQARQKMANELYQGLVSLTHPPLVTAGVNGERAHRWLAQLAVNIVDYIDNDDYPTWFQVGATANAENIVWGTELPRLVINEVYAEAVNDPMDPLPMNQAQNPYHVRHWVELYNPLMSDTYYAWPDGANSRLNVNNTSVYRMLITPQTNATRIRSANSPDFTPNNMGYPDDILAANTNVITFPPNATVDPSHDNYGTGQQPTVPYPNPGFYLVGPGMQPDGTMPNAPAGPDFPAANLDHPQMEVQGRITQVAGRFADNANNRQVILLQRLANPYLPHNPVPPPPASPTSISNMLAVGDVINANSPYNPYITIDYVENIAPNHAVLHSADGSADNQNFDPATGMLQAGVQYRRSIGKMQPYAAVNEAAAPPATTMPQTVWQPQRPDENKTTPGHQPLVNQVQHTFMRHNAVEGVFPLADPFVNPQPDANGLLTYNTLKLPFEWLKHLDRAPTSPVDLMQVSGYRPHELTQQFNQVSTVNVSSTVPAIPGLTLTAGNVITFNGPFVNQLHGTPYSLKNFDLVEIVYTISDGVTTRTASEKVPALNVDLTGALPRFDATTTLTTNAGETVTGAMVRQFVPHAHFAPWYRATQHVQIQSSNRLYRLLEGVAVRNPGVHVGQYRFTSGALPSNTNNIYRVAAADTPPIGSIAVPSDENSVWIQLDNGVTVIPGDGVPNHAATHMISTNDALIAMVGAGNPQLDPTRAVVNTFTAANVGDTVVINAGQPTEERAMILEIDHQNNRIRTVLSAMPAPGTNANLPLTIDFAYVAGRQPGRINLNTMWDLETFRALADAQLMNAFTNTGPGLFDDNVDLVFRRLFQQRQPQYFYNNRMVGTTGVYNPGAIIPEDRPFQGMATGDIAPNREIPLQGIGNTLLSDRYQEGPGGYEPIGTPNGRATDMSSPVLGDNGDIHRFTRTLFEVGAPGLAHPARRFELLSKIWNNTTVRSNTFSVWITIGFFEYDEATNSIGAELGQLQGKNVRHRFFAIVDRSSIDSWLRSWNIHATNGGTQPASINLFMNSSLFPTLDPRHETYPILNGGVSTTAFSNGAYGRINAPATSLNLPGNGSTLPGIWGVNITAPTPNPFPLVSNHMRLVQIQSSAGTEIAQIVDPTQLTPPLALPAFDLYLKLTIPHPPNDVLTIRPLPVPPTVLHWSQLK